MEAIHHMIESAGGRNVHVAEIKTDGIVLYQANYDVDGILPDGSVREFHETELYWEDGRLVRPHDPMDDFGGFDIHRGL